MDQASARIAVVMLRADCRGRCASWRRERSEIFAAGLPHLHEGLSNKEIANRLNIAEVTVKTRLGRLYKKFGVSTRLQLRTTAIREDMVV